jgi:hypothetical protein
MADLKTQIETAKKIREQKRCIGIICSACPAGEKNSGSTCDDKFGPQTYYYFGDKALAWFENWLKENDVERICRTCRFSFQNTKSKKAECPQDGTITPCILETNYPKWQPIPKEEQQEEVKMKQVVLEVPSKEVYIDVKWLRDNGDCGAGEKYFINRYGKDAKIKWNTHYYDLKQENNTAGLKFMDDHRPQQPEGDYVHIDYVDKNKIYIVVGENKLFKLQRTSNDTWAFCSLDDSSCLADGWCSNMKGKIEETIRINSGKVYEFKIFNDFTKAYQAGKI